MTRVQWGCKGRRPDLVRDDVATRTTGQLAGDCGRNIVFSAGTSGNAGDQAHPFTAHGGASDAH